MAIAAGRRVRAEKLEISGVELASSLIFGCARCEYFANSCSRTAASKSPFWDGMGRGGF